MTAEVEFIASVVPAGPGPAEAPAAPRDADYPIRVAAAVSEAGFDKLLVGYAPRAPDGLLVASLVLTTSASLGVVVTQVPGLVAPTVAARQYATLAAFHRDRVAMHVIIHDEAGEAGPGAPDGDDCDPAAKPRRAAEFLEVVRLAWSSAGAFTYSGEFYQVSDAWAAIRPARGRLPVYFAGVSGEAIRVGARHADVYSFWGEPLAGIRELIGRVRAASADAGRAIRDFCVSLRPIAADTETAAWQRARDLLELARDQASARGAPSPPMQAEGARRLLRYAARADLHDKRLWTAMSVVTGAPGNSTALVGSYEQVAESLLDYVSAGASGLLIRGYDPLADATAYGRLIRLVHDKVGDDLDGYRARVRPAA